MSEIALEGLLIRLKSSLTLANRQWLAEHLVEPTREIVSSYTIEELCNRAERGVQQIEAGQGIPASECAARREQLIHQYSL